MIEENLDSLNGMQLLQIYAGISFYVIIFTMIVSGIYIGQVLQNFSKIRANQKHLETLKAKQDIIVIEGEIKREIKKKKLRDSKFRY